MTFTGFNKDDFDVFHIPGLESRMEALRTQIQPKFHQLGEIFAPVHSLHLGDPFYVHVAKHARRTVNPPSDSWVAWSPQRRGYKNMPHFQLGLWDTHLFIWFAIIYEVPNKAELGAQLAQDTARWINEIPSHFVWSIDHTKKEVLPHQDLTKAKLQHHLERLQQVKKAELLCGMQIPNHDPILQDGEQLIAYLEEQFQYLYPLYQATRLIPMG